VLYLSVSVFFPEQWSLTRFFLTACGFYVNSSGNLSGKRVQWISPIEAIGKRSSISKGQYLRTCLSLLGSIYRRLQPITPRGTAYENWRVVADGLGQL
jgi:hypothetical protein